MCSGEALDIPNVIVQSRRKIATSEGPELEEGSSVDLFYLFIDLSFKKKNQFYIEYVRIRNVNPMIVLCLNNGNKFLKSHLKY